ncbi:MAG: hypothetical protein A2X86_08990 [Bdellovibrionales bacterium GWA2_49_15]|nr:MAG: hypothetical protein A2X86_08990 [Bdellovibrionales bacterium GWA2_49_15]HAZ12913.1 hypothetical protein [Bdellovibrionales bacterium]
METQKTWKISKLVWIGAGIFILGFLPIILYSLFGPKDGNPIGLGLLSMISAPIGFLVFLIGAVKTTASVYKKKGGGSR